MKRTWIVSVVWVFLLLGFSLDAESKAQLTHYIVFEMEGGIIKPYRHQFVYMATPPSKTEEEVSHQMGVQNFHEQKFSLKLPTPSGGIVHRDIVEVPLWSDGGGEKGSPLTRDRLNVLKFLK